MRLTRLTNTNAHRHSHTLTNSFYLPCVQNKRMNEHYTYFLIPRIVLAAAHSINVIRNNAKSILEKASMVFFYLQIVHGFRYLSDKLKPRKQKAFSMKPLFLLVYYVSDYV